jgi:hypothetical protein
MPKGMTPRDRRVKKATKPIRKAFKKLTEGMMIIPRDALQTGPRRIKTDGRITKEDMEKYMKKKPREFKTGIPRLTKGPMQARPLPMTPEMIKKMKDRKVPNPKATPRDRSKPNLVTPMRRRKSATKQPVGFRERRATGTRAK